MYRRENWSSFSLSFWKYSDKKVTSWYCKGEPGIFASGPEDERSKGRDALEKDRGDETKVNIHLFHHWQNHCWLLQQLPNISGLNLWLTFLLIDTIQFHRNHSYRRSRWAHSDIHFGLYKPFFVLRIEPSNSRSISKLKLNFVLWHFQKHLMQLFVW